MNRHREPEMSGSTEILVRTVTLTPPQLKSLSSNPVELIPAPGPEQVIWPIDAFFRFNPNTLPYNGGGVGAYLALALGVPMDAPFDLATFMNSANPVVFIDKLVPVGLFPYANLPLILATAGPDVQAGDGSLTITVRYTILSTTAKE